MASAVTSDRPRRGRPRRCSTCSAPTRSPSTRTSGRRRSPRSSRAEIGSPTSCAGRRTRGPARCRACASRRTPPRTPRRSRFMRGSRGGRPAGVRAAPSGSWSGRPLRMSCGRSARSLPDSPSSCRASAPRVGKVEPVLEAGQASAPPAGGRPGGGLLVNVSRGIAGAASSLGGSGPRDPLERVAEAAREWAGRLPVLP